MVDVAHLLPLCFACALGFIKTGGGLYEFTVVDPVWPRWPQIIQPTRGGMSRARFWILSHSTFELSMIISLIVFWSSPSVRRYLLIAFIAHLIMRVWSAIDFIPKALAFEKRDPDTITEAEALRWTGRSAFRFPLDGVTCIAVLAALVQAAR